MTVKISCNNQHTIELKKADGTTKAFRTDQSLGAGWLIVDIIPGGIISIVVDAVTGSWYYVTPKEVTIDNPIKEKQSVTDSCAQLRSWALIYYAPLAIKKIQGSMSHKL